MHGRNRPVQINEQRGISHVNTMMTGREETLFTLTIVHGIRMVQLILNDTFCRGKVPVCAPSWAVGTDKQAQGCAGEGLNPEGLSPRLRARVLAVTCKMLLFQCLILDRLHLL